MSITLEQLSARMRQGEQVPLRHTAQVALTLSIPSILQQIVVTAHGVHRCSHGGAYRCRRHRFHLASSVPAHGCCTGCWPGCAWRFPFRWRSIWAQTASRTPGAFCGSPCCSIWRWVLRQRPLAWASAGFCPGGWAQTRHCRQTLRPILPSGRLPCPSSWPWAPMPPCCAPPAMP